jgi:hypothetical protein
MNPFAELLPKIIFKCVKIAFKKLFINCEFRYTLLIGL